LLLVWSIFHENWLIISLTKLEDSIAESAKKGQIVFHIAYLWYSLVMLVRDLMSNQVVSVKPSTSISEVAELLHVHGFAGLPVVNEAGTVVGLITERELFSGDSRLYLPSYIKLLQETNFVIGGHKTLPYAAEQITRTTAADIMNQKVIFVQPNLEVSKLAEMFAVHHQSPMPVVDSANKLLGIISRSDLVKLLIAPETRVNLPLAPARPASLGQARTAPVEMHSARRIDEEISYVSTDINSRFAYVAKARANIWLTTAVVLFVVGFVAGVIYVADPEIFVRKESSTISH
jgi:CBS domain-containing protein